MAEAPLILVVYVSSAVAPFPPEALAELLRQARRRNEADGITGMLLYRSGNFIQAVEGPSLAVEALLDRLGRDPRHRDVTRILRQPIAARGFAAWSMGFDALADPALRADPGFTDFLERIDSGPLDPSAAGIALRLLERFKQTNR